MTESEPSGVNVPLLRKAVEWAEAEAMKPPELCEWNQGAWVVPLNVADAVAWGYAVGEIEDDRQDLDRSADCGTCYCIAGYVTASTVGPGVGVSVQTVARGALGLDKASAGRLFRCDNTIADVRRIAEDLAGERL